LCWEAIEKKNGHRTPIRARVHYVTRFCEPTSFRSRVPKTQPGRTYRPSHLEIKETTVAASKPFNKARNSQPRRRAVWSDAVRRCATWSWSLDTPTPLRHATNSMRRRIETVHNIYSNPNPANQKSALARRSELPPTTPR